MRGYPVQIGNPDIKPVEDGFIIYDEDRDKVHYLNPIATLVLILCNGRNSTEEIVDLVRKQYGLAEPPEKEITTILSQFVDELLVKIAERP